MPIYRRIRNRISTVLLNNKDTKIAKLVYASNNTYKFLCFQSQLALETFRDALAKSDSSITPPARLRHRVHGRLDRQSFVRSGSLIAQDIQRLCELSGNSFDSFEHVLDFGCGSGRVITNLMTAAPETTFFGTDIDPELVNWCEHNLSGVKWNINQHMPPLNYSDNSFDLIYAISVFTHLNEHMQIAWLEELRRVAKPGATLLLSVHGDFLAKQSRSYDSEKLATYGFEFVDGAHGSLKLDKLPDFYQTSFHTQDYIQRIWSRYFEILHYVPQGIIKWQDVVVLRKPVQQSINP